MQQFRWVSLVVWACFCALELEAQEPYWRQTYPFASSYGYVSTMAFASGTTLVLGGDGGLVAADVRSGVMAWSAPGDCPFFAISPTGAIFTARAEGNDVTVSRLTAGGKIVWEADIGGVTPDPAPAALRSLSTVGGVAYSGGRVFVLVNSVARAGNGRTDFALGCLACDAETGRPAWKTSLRIAEALSNFGTSLLAAAGGRLYAAGHAYVLGQDLNTAVFCLAQSDGAIQWSDSMTGLGNGIDEIVRNGLAVASDGGLLALAASDGAGGSATTVILRFAGDGTRTWITRIGSPDGPAVPAAMGVAGGDKVYVAGTSGETYAAKRLSVNACDARTGRIMWSASWQPDDGGPSGASACAVGTRSLFVAGWWSECGLLTCMAPAIVSFDLATGALAGAYVSERAGAGGQLTAAAFLPDGFLATAGVRYDQSLFRGPAEAILATDLDQHAFVRADANADGRVGIADVVAVLEYLFARGRSPCLDAADVDNSGRVSLTDAIRLLLFLFADGRIPDAPFPLCGGDGAHDLLSCRAAAGCAD